MNSIEEQQFQDQFHALLGEKENIISFLTLGSYTGDTLKNYTDILEKGLTCIRNYYYRREQPSIPLGDIQTETFLEVVRIQEEKIRTLLRILKGLQRGERNMRAVMITYLQEYSSENLEKMEMVEKAPSASTLPEPCISTSSIQNRIEAISTSIR